MRLELALLGLVLYLIIAAVIVMKRGKKQHNLAVPTAAGLLCFAIFVVVNVLDWPGAVLTTFWADHAIVSATASTIPLAGAGFFAFKVYDASVQAELDEKIAATGRSGLVDHLVDVDVALGLLSLDEEEVGQRWRAHDADRSRPLRWLRDRRRLLGTLQAEDPRHAPKPAELRWGELQDQLIDESVRRMMGGIRDWGPILARSRAGEHDLIDLGSIRLALLSVGRGEAYSPTEINGIQESCRALAWCFEKSSNPRRTRSELLMRPDACQHKRRHVTKDRPRGLLARAQPLDERRIPEVVRHR